jgi:hypothetical protein
MNNEPVAWRIKNPQMFNEWIVFSNKEQASLYAFHNGKGNLAEPLYTHPAKTLTDEEIEGIARANVDGHSSMEQLKWFARAILRKAQEK